MFKKNPIKHNNSFTNKNKSFINELLNTPSKFPYPYSVNKSEPFIITPQIGNKNMAYLMTPCYILDNDDINYKNVKEYNKKFGRDIINGYYLSSPQKGKSFFRTKSSEFLNNEDPFYHIYMKNAKSRKNDNNRKYNKYSAKNRIYFPSYENSNLFKNNVKRIENRSKNKKINRPNSSDKNHIFFGREQYPIYFDTNNDNNLYNKSNRIKKNRNNEIFNLNENDFFTLSGDNNINGKIYPENKTNNSNNSNRKKNNYQNQDINRQILNNLYDNNFMNNKYLRMQDYNFGIQNKKNDNKNNNKKNKSKNILETNTDRKPNSKYAIFNNNIDDSNRMNKTNDFLFPNKFDNKDVPYNKILNIGKISSSNFSVINSSKKNIPFGKDTKKLNNSHSNNNNSNNSNSQSNNNIGVNHISTNYTGGHSYYSSNRENRGQNNYNKSKNDNNKNNKSENSSKPLTPLEISPVLVNEYFRDSIGKKSNTSSNKVSLQSLSDSKMLELAGHYGLGDESSSDNYQMNNVIHNKKRFFRNSNV